MYDIGQVIYIFKETNDSLFPCVVCEEVVKKTLEGTNVSYKVLLPDSEGTVIDLSKMDVSVFKDLDDFKKQYVEKAKDRASFSIKKCKEISKEKFKKYESNAISKSKEPIEENNKSVVIEDNVKLNIDMSKLQELGIWNQQANI